jgi:hypothetical protein
MQGMLLSVLSIMSWFVTLKGYHGLGAWIADPHTADAAAALISTGLTLWAGAAKGLKQDAAAPISNPPKGK